MMGLLLEALLFLKKEGRASRKTVSLEACALGYSRIVVNHEGRLESKNLSEESFHASIRVPTHSTGAADGPTL